MQTSQFRLNVWTASLLVAFSVAFGAGTLGCSGSKSAAPAGVEVDPKLVQFVRDANQDSDLIDTIPIRSDVAAFIACRNDGTVHRIVGRLSDDVLPVIDKLPYDVDAAKGKAFACGAELRQMYYRSEALKRIHLVLMNAAPDLQHHAVKDIDACTTMENPIKCMDYALDAAYELTRQRRR